jgi:hypothetical protein
MTKEQNDKAKAELLAMGKGKKELAELLDLILLSPQNVAAFKAYIRAK